MIVSAFTGALLAVAIIPGARSTVEAEVVMSLGGRPEWARAATGESWARLRRVAARHPDDADLQVGLATLPPEEPDRAGASEEAATGGNAYSATIRGLEALEQRFPRDAAIRAHLLRHLTRGGQPAGESGVQIDRPELARVNGPVRRSARPRPRHRPAPEMLRVFITAAEGGARLEPENAYFDAMRAVGEFAADQDEAALRDLHAAAEKPGWDDHATEETRAQWNLLDEAYGDRGIVQRSAGIEHLLLPHYAQLRAAAHLAVWHGAQREKAGDLAAARAIRHDVMQLGMTMAHASPLMIGKTVGLAIFETGTSPVPPDPPLSAPSREAFDAAMRERHQRYEKALLAQGQTAEADWVRAQRERGELLRNRTNQVQAEWQSLGGMSPERWEGWWTFGILLLEQIGVLLALWAGAALLARIRDAEPAGLTRPAAIGWAAVTMLVLTTTSVLIAAAPTFGLSWRSLDFEMAARLFAGLIVLLCAMNIAARGRKLGGANTGGYLMVAAAICVAIVVVPTLLWTATGSTPLLEGSLLTGLAAMGALGMAGRAGRRPVSRESRPRWKPALVALLAIVPSAALTFLGRDILALSESLTSRLLASHSGMWAGDPQANPGLLPMLLLLPVILLLLFQLCRVVALRMPFWSGMGRGLGQTAPRAIMMLLAVYLVALVPTIARDRAAEHRLDRVLTDELRGITQQR